MIYISVVVVVVVIAVIVVVEMYNIYACKHISDPKPFFFSQVVEMMALKSNKKAVR
jgi:hypothetical protein